MASGVSLHELTSSVAKHCARLSSISFKPLQQFTSNALVASVKCCSRRFVDSPNASGPTTSPTIPTCVSDSVTRAAPPPPIPSRSSPPPPPLLLLLLLLLPPAPAAPP